MLLFAYLCDSMGFSLDSRSNRLKNSVQIGPIWCHLDPISGDSDQSEGC